MGDSLVVDLSNVAKDPLLGFSTQHASLVRWDRLQTVWTQDRGIPEHVLLVADSSLVSALSRQEKLRLERWVASNYAIVVPDADVEVLRHAREVDGIALSNDRYVDHRRIEGLERVKLVGWVVRGGEIRLQNRSLDRLLSAMISERGYKQEMKRQGLDKDAPELKFRWRCAYDGCNEDLVLLPTNVRGSLQCPRCSSYLEQGRPWNSPIWIKILDTSGEVTRFVLEDGDQVFIGRSPGDGVIALDGLVSDGQDLSTVGERHLELQNTHGVLRIRDNGSQHGTRIRRPAAGDLNRLSPPMPILSSDYAVVGRGTKIVLGQSKVAVQISGFGSV